MGLDMYLTAEKYVSGWEHNRDPEFDKLVKLIGIQPHAESPGITISVPVGYWRKANAIHRWFVEHVQGGKDECQRSYVKKKQLEELRAACTQVLNTVEVVDGDVSQGTTHYPGGTVTRHTKRGSVVAQKGIADQMLPTQSGFFFGRTDYDECYLQDLKDTVAIIDRVLSDPKLDHCLYYRASW